MMTTYFHAYLYFYQKCIFKMVFPKKKMQRHNINAVIRFVRFLFGKTIGPVRVLTSYRWQEFAATSPLVMSDMRSVHIYTHEIKEKDARQTNMSMFVITLKRYMLPGYVWQKWSQVLGPLPSSFQAPSIYTDDDIYNILCNRTNH